MTEKKPTPATKTTQKKVNRDGCSASINLTDVMPQFEKLKSHCEKQAPWAKHNNADIVRFAILHAANSLKD
jgi:hypothetical protein